MRRSDEEAGAAAMGTAGEGGGSKAAGLLQMGDTTDRREESERPPATSQSRHPVGATAGRPSGPRGCPDDAGNKEPRERFKDSSAVCGCQRASGEM